MATLRVAPKPAAEPMKVAQISKPGGDFEIVERDIPEPDAGQVRIKVQACGVGHTATCSSRKVFGPAFNIPVSQDMKWWASSMKWAPAFPLGRWVSAWALAGMAGRMAPVASAAAETFAIAAT